MSGGSGGTSRDPEGRRGLGGGSDGRAAGGARVKGAELRPKDRFWAESSLRRGYSAPVYEAGSQSCDTSGGHTEEPDLARDGPVALAAERDGAEGAP